jgi:hypothetical protein
MNKRLWLVVFICVFAFADTPTARIPYFKFVRDVKVNGGGKLSYVILDEQVWRGTQADLRDLRLYNGDAEVPFVLHEERSHSTTAHEAVRILNKGVVGGKTQLVLDLSLPEYDHVELMIDAKNYIAKVTAEGANDANALQWAKLTEATFFDLSSERLGDNTTVKFATPATFRYLRLTFVGPIKPGDVVSAHHALLRTDKADYAKLSVTPQITQEGRRTVATWKSDGRVPLERVEFTIDPGQINFSRPVNIICDGRNIATSEVTRVRLNRQGRKIESEQLAVDLDGARCKDYRVEVENGDDRQLAISAVTPMLLERRVYFDPKSGANLNLYYGDEKLPAPRYDFAKFFVPSDEADATRSELGVESVNAAFTGRPDERPWSERNAGLMWAAMIIAVAGLGFWALRGFKQ